MAITLTEDDDMANLNRPSITTGPLTADDLDAARRNTTGRVYHLHRVSVAQCPPCDGDCNQGRDCQARQQQPAEASTEIGADDEPCRPPMTATGVVICLLGWPVVIVFGLALWSLFA